MRTLIVLLAVILAVLQFRLWLSDGGLRQVWRLEEQVLRRTEENRHLDERNASLAAEVQDLKSGLSAAEERARSELGMVLPEESFYLIVPPDKAERILRQAPEVAAGAQPLPGVAAGAQSLPGGQEADGRRDDSAPLR